MLYQIFTGILMLSLSYETGSARIVVDLTHTLDEEGPKFPISIDIWPDFTHFKAEIMREEYVNWGTEGMWLSIGRDEFYEHYGTHLDAPKHFGKGRQSMAEIPPERLVGPGIVINVKEKVRENPNYAVTVFDLLEFEEEYGRIPSRSIVMMNSGWSHYYPNAVLFFGSKNLTDIRTYNYPGFGLDACEFLLAERQVSIVGVDTNSVDPGQPQEVHGRPYPCHFHLQPNNVPLLENVANLDSIPSIGTTIFLGGLKTKIGTGGPTRVLAIIDDENDEGDTVSNFAEISSRPCLSMLWSLIAAKYAFQ